MEINELYGLFEAHPKVVTDTRADLQGALFFALKGERFNGNAFAAEALAKGAAYVVIDEPQYAVENDAHYIVVDDVLQTLQALAHEHRERLALPVVQITGTNGKTTTKELVSAVLAQRYRVHFTQGNLNNHIGVPHTLLQLTPEHEVAVIETGANHGGEIALLSTIVDADFGLITNVGRAHLEGFGSLEGVKKAKGELYDFLREKQAKGQEVEVFLDADNAALVEMAEGLPTVTYAMAKGADVEGEGLDGQPYVRLRWRRRGGEWHEVQTQLIGAYNVTNLLAAAAVGLSFGVDEGAISEALASYAPTNNRSELVRTPHNQLIVDAYNANPTSMAAAVDNFAKMEVPKKMMVLGGMRELGAASVEEHRKLVKRLAQVGAEKIWLVGEEFAPFADVYRYFETAEAVREALEQERVEGYWVLVKGSNSHRLATLAAAF